MARLARTILLGTIAAGAGIWWLARAYDVESTQLLGFLLSSAILVALTIVAAVGGGAALFCYGEGATGVPALPTDLSFEASARQRGRAADPAGPSDP